MINNLKAKIPYLAIFLLGYFFVAQTASAAILNLGIDPSIITINAIPPTSVTSPINIQNRSDYEVTLQIQLKSFKAKGENGEPVYSDEAPEIFKNIQILDADLPVASITLNPKQQKTLTLKIDVPDGTSLTDYYFSVIFISINSPTVESNSATNQAGIATNVLLSVGPLETPKAVLQEYSSGIFFEKGPVPFMLRIKNEGIHFIKPRGDIVVKNIFGQSVGKLNLIGTNILADSTRAIPNDAYVQELKSARIASSPNFRNPIVIWNESFLLGLYSATLNISMSNDGPTFTKTIHFFAFPFQYLIIIVIILIAVIVVATRLKLHMKKNRT